MIMLGALNTAFAQSRSGKNDRWSRTQSRESVYNRNDSRYDTRDYPGNPYGYGSNRNDRYGSSRNDDRYYEERRRQEECDRINREYDNRIDAYRRDRSMNEYERNRRIEQEERQRKEKLKSFAGGAVVGAVAGVLVGILISK